MDKAMTTAERMKNIGDGGFRCGEAAEQAKRKRVEDAAHRAKIENEAHTAIWDILNDENLDGVSNKEISGFILSDIRDGKIPHIIIKY